MYTHRFDISSFPNEHHIILYAHDSMRYLLVYNGIMWKHEILCPWWRRQMIQHINQILSDAAGRGNTQMQLNSTAILYNNTSCLGRYILLSLVIIGSHSSFV